MLLLPDLRRSERIEQLRLFYALWPDKATRDALANLQLSIRGRIILPQNLHITLAFLGDQPVWLLPTLRTILEGLNFPRIDLKIDRIGFFARSRIAWAGMNTVPPELAKLHTDLRKELGNNRIQHDERERFTPHITLARKAVRTESVSFAPISWQADHVALVHSPMSGAGSLYRVLASRRLTQ
jgi:2'-5' RNA ligase